ncbi:MAG: precorrin-2 C(20)-methyltransferase [Deltaproteobacteria bacterium]|nr:MAG: precorrin-2 C(20)-methyltransferase [Deltaproteobacteria bacterium]
MRIKAGTFYGIGVGPGDPELLTVKAVNAIRDVDVVFTAGHQRSGVSMAGKIAYEYLKDKEVVALPFPHTFDSVSGRSPHREAAEKIVEALKRPASVAFLTIGDPMTFSTFTYVLEAVRELDPTVPVKVIPGITSFAAAAAATITPLAEGEESFAVVGAAKTTEKLSKAIDAVDNLVIMKPYRHSEEVCDILDERGLGMHTWFCVECSRPHERCYLGLDAAREEGADKYMSLFIVRKEPK